MIGPPVVTQSLGASRGRRGNAKRDSFLGIVELRPAPAEPVALTFSFDGFAHVDAGDTKAGCLIDMLGTIIVIGNAQLYLLKSRPRLPAPLRTA